MLQLQLRWQLAGDEWLAVLGRVDSSLLVSTTARNMFGVLSQAVSNIE